MNALDKISQIIRDKEKAKLAILMELADKEMSLFELDDIIQGKYYNENFRTFPFIKVLKEEELFEEKEGEYRIVRKSNFLRCSSGIKMKLIKSWLWTLEKETLQGNSTSKRSTFLAKS